MLVYWTHTKTGRRYAIKGFAIQEDSLAPIVIYEDIVSLDRWTRPCAEFFDGRFLQTVSDVPPESDTFMP